LEYLPTLLGEHLVDAHKSVSIPMIVSKLETMSFNIDVDQGNIDLHIYEEPKFVELNSKHYYGLSRSEKIFNASYSATVHARAKSEY
jgi:hypothetical protein